MSDSMFTSHPAGGSRPQHSGNKFDELTAQMTGQFATGDGENNMAAAQNSQNANIINNMAGNMSQNTNLINNMAGSSSQNVNLMNNGQNLINNMANSQNNQNANLMNTLAGGSSQNANNLVNNMASMDSSELHYAQALLRHAPRLASSGDLDSSSLFRLAQAFITLQQGMCVYISDGHIESGISNIDIFVNIDIVSKQVKKYQ